MSTYVFLIVLVLIALFAAIMFYSFYNHKTTPTPTPTKKTVVKLEPTVGLSGSTPPPQAEVEAYTPFTDWVNNNENFDFEQSKDKFNLLRPTITITVKIPADPGVDTVNDKYPKMKKINLRFKKYNVIDGAVDTTNTNISKVEWDILPDVDVFAWGSIITMTITKNNFVVVGGVGGNITVESVDRTINDIDVWDFLTKSSVDKASLDSMTTSPTLSADFNSVNFTDAWQLEFTPHYYGVTDSQGTTLNVINNQTDDGGVENVQILTSTEQFDLSNGITIAPQISRTELGEQAGLDISGLTLGILATSDTDNDTIVVKLGAQDDYLYAVHTLHDQTTEEIKLMVGKGHIEAQTVGFNFDDSGSNSIKIQIGSLGRLNIIDTDDNSFTLCENWLGAVRDDVKWYIHLDDTTQKIYIDQQNIEQPIELGAYIKNSGSTHCVTRNDTQIATSNNTDNDTIDVQFDDEGFLVYEFEGIDYRMNVGQNHLLTNLSDFRLNGTAHDNIKIQIGTLGRLTIKDTSGRSFTLCEKWNGAMASGAIWSIYLNTYDRIIYLNQNTGNAPNTELGDYIKKVGNTHCVDPTLKYYMFFAHCKKFKVSQRHYKLQGLSSLNGIAATWVNCGAFADFKTSKNEDRPYWGIDGHADWNQVQMTGIRDDIRTLAREAKLQEFSSAEAKSFQDGWYHRMNVANQKKDPNKQDDIWINDEEESTLHPDVINESNLGGENWLDWSWTQFRAKLPYVETLNVIQNSDGTRIDKDKLFLIKVTVDTFKKCSLDYGREGSNRYKCPYSTPTCQDYSQGHWGYCRPPYESDFLSNPTGLV